MLFNSPSYFLIFLPLAVLIFFTLAKFSKSAPIVFLVIASFIFYGYWNPSYLILILLSIIINYAVGSKLISDTVLQSKKKRLLIGAIIFNLALLGYYKYAGFFVANVDLVFGTNITISKIVLPLAISFFTFQQIAYLVDSYRGIIRQNSFTSYCLFVAFFPQLIAGPIVHYQELYPQYKSESFIKVNWNNINKGLFIFALGLFKKVVLADNFSSIANMGFDGTATMPLNFIESWIVALSYTLQIYFDFSGYTDMAIGSALLFNVKLPINFNSPYRCLNIQDFWRRWHMTLSRWLRDYLYIPLGGNRVGRYRILINLLITFILGGLWHGAAWTFVIWGTLHGIALCIHRVWSSYTNKTGFSLPNWLAWIIMFVFINVTWVFFRANDVNQALSIINSMFNINKFSLSFNFFESIYYFLNQAIPVEIAKHLSESYFNGATFVFIIICYYIILTKPTSVDYIENITQNNAISKKSLLLITLIAIVAIYMSLVVNSQVFLYFNF